MRRGKGGSKAGRRTEKNRKEEKREGNKERGGGRERFHPILSFLRKCDIETQLNAFDIINALEVNTTGD